MGPVFISSTNIFWFLIFTNKVVIEEIKFHEMGYRKLLKLKEYDGIFSSLMHKFYFPGIWAVADLERWYYLSQAICWIEVSICEYFWAFKKKSCWLWCSYEISQIAELA